MKMKKAKQALEDIDCFIKRPRDLLQNDVSTIDCV